MLRNRTFTWHTLEPLVQATFVVAATAVIGSVVTAGCKQPAPAAAPSYRLIRNASTNPDGTVNVPLYEKGGDTNRYYTPAINGMDWVPLMR